MPDGIERYLDELKRSLTGCDPATIQDALSDAEDHLRTALDQTLRNDPNRMETEALQMIVEKYGTPQETAAAYREIESRTTPALAGTGGDAGERSWAGKVFGVLAEPRAYGALLYMFFALATGIMYFTWTVTGISLSAGLIVLIIGLPFIGVFLLSIHGIALVEGRIVEALLGVRMPRRPLFSQKHLGVWRRFKTLLGDRITWTTILYMIVMLPLGIVYFTLFVTMMVFVLRLIGSPIFDLIFDFPVMMLGDTAYYIPDWTVPFAVLAGIIWLIVTLHLARVVGRMHGAIAKNLLVRD
ncbi:MAG TPA: sensor domain-containing protein [Patescibacteria group bacterium]|nr:sensor domain-containing protein [Patescibacteria group bacterium]